MDYRQSTNVNGFPPGIFIAGLDVIADAVASVSAANRAGIRYYARDLRVLSRGIIQQT